MLSFVTFKWNPLPGYRSNFAATHVNTLAAMVRAHYRGAHRFIVVTDDAAGVDPSIEVVPLWNDFADLMSPHGARFPSCYRRLKLFARDAGATFGPRIVQLDLDCVVAGDLTPLVERAEDFVAWGGTNRSKGGYNCSFLVLRAGTRTKVWDDFDPVRSPALASAAGCIGSDQAWLSYCLGRGREPTFGAADGVYSYRNDIVPARGKLPANARVVFFHGSVDPWSGEAQRLDWVRRHYGARELA